ncbi:MAG: beta-aspartyl-peptidase [Gammaproteobacteria bacterium]|nr:beta-aspartyl-peptidase [Gammaproteobacteria bacterium]
MFIHITNAQVFAPESLGVQHLLVAAGKIVSMSPDAIDLGSIENVVTVDAEGRRLIPGLVDGHSHINGGGGESGYSSRVPTVKLSQYTGAGVTTVVGLLGTDDTVHTTGSLVTGARGLIDEGLSAYCYTGGYHVPCTTLTGSVRGDIVYIDPIIGVGELAISDHRSSQPTLDELLRVAADSHVAGMMTGKAGVVHLHLGDGERRLSMVHDAIAQSEIPARVFNPTHVNRNEPLFLEAMELTKAGCTIDITAYPLVEGDTGIGADRALIRYLESGCSPDHITVSSDGGGCLPQFDDDGHVTRMGVGDPRVLLDVINALARVGVPLEDVVPAFTSNVARHLRLRYKGVVAKGCDADLVVLNEDGSLWGTMAMGQWHVQDSQLLRLGHFENL